MDTENAKKNGGDKLTEVLPKNYLKPALIRYGEVTKLTAIGKTGAFADGINSKKIVST